MMITDIIPDPIKNWIDVGAVGGTGLAFLDVITLNNISLLVGIVWLAIRIWETDTVQKWFKKDK